MAADQVSGADRTATLALIVSNMLATNTICLDAIQIVTWLDVSSGGLPALSTRLYVDARYSPGVGVPTYYGLDGQSGQTTDSSEFWGDDKMLEIVCDSSCGLNFNTLNINRFVKLSIAMAPVSEQVEAPDLPDTEETATPPAYPY
jgi:hypothetical protein